MVKAVAQVTEEPVEKSPTCSQPQGRLPSQRLLMLKSSKPSPDLSQRRGSLSSITGF
jgi:hypothetical protein